MPQTGEQCLEFLEKAREAVSELSVAEDSERQMEQDCQRLERELEAEQKQMADAVQATVKSAGRRSVPAMIRRSTRLRIC